MHYIKKRQAKSYKKLPSANVCQDPEQLSKVRLEIGMCCEQAVPDWGSHKGIHGIKAAWHLFNQWPNHYLIILICSLCISQIQLSQAICHSHGDINTTLTIAQHSASQHLTATLRRIKHRVFGTFLQREYQRVPESTWMRGFESDWKKSQCWIFKSSCWQCKEAGHGKCWGHRGSWESVACEAIQKGTMPVSMAGPSHLRPWPRNVTSLIFEDVASCPVSEILQPQIIPKMPIFVGSQFRGPHLCYVKYIYIYIYTYTTCIYIFTYIRFFTYINVYIYIHIYICTFIDM